jgi:hypothetical protein
MLPDEKFLRQNIHQTTNSMRDDRCADSDGFKGDHRHSLVVGTDYKAVKLGYARDAVRPVAVKRNQLRKPEHSCLDFEFRAQRAITYDVKLPHPG